MTEYRIRSGLSTRTVQLTTGELVNFSREALESAAQQVASGFIPMSVEHLSYLPPRGRITRAEIETDAEGQAELVVYGQDLKFLRAGNLSLASVSPSTAEQREPLSDITIGVEPRNYRPEAWQELIAGSPLPVVEKANWSGLPALIYTLSIPVVWGAVKFAGSFFERLGTAAADGLVTWIKGAAESAKEPNREALVEISFYLKDGGPTILGFVPLDARSDVSATALSAAVDQAGLLAEFAGSVADGQQPRELRQCAFIWDSDRWRLGWWATDEAVFVSPWFSENYPDPQRFLGRPLFSVDTGQGSDLKLPDIGSPDPEI